MVGLLGVVRPFQTTNVNPPATPQANAAGATPQNTKLVVGRGSPKTFTGTFDLTIAYYKVRRPKEKQKQ
jgi:hypothetical protein